MKNIVRTCLVAVALMITISANAQLPVQFGVNAGMNLSNVSGEDSDDAKAKVGFQVGFTVDYNITQGLFLQSGLSFTTKGTKIENTEVYYGIPAASVASDDIIQKTEKETKTSINAMYLQLPVRIGYKIPVTDEFKININAGPYIAYGLGGKVKLKYKEKYKETVGSPVIAYDFENEYNTFDDELKKFDFGVGFGIGVEFGKFGLNIGYELGLANIAGSKMKLENNIEMRKYSDIKNRNAFLAIGYKF